MEHFHQIVWLIEGPSSIRNLRVVSDGPNSSQGLYLTVTLPSKPTICIQMNPLPISSIYAAALMLPSIHRNQQSALMRCLEAVFQCPQSTYWRQCHYTACVAVLRWVSQFSTTGNLTDQGPQLLCSEFIAAFSLTLPSSSSQPMIDSFVKAGPFLTDRRFSWWWVCFQDPV